MIARRVVLVAAGGISGTLAVGSNSGVLTFPTAADIQTIITDTNALDEVLGIIRQMEVNLPNSFRPPRLYTPGLLEITQARDYYAWCDGHREYRQPHNHITTWLNPVINRRLMPSRHLGRRVRKR